MQKLLLLLGAATIALSACSSASSGPSSEGPAVTASGAAAAVDLRAASNRGVTVEDHQSQSPAASPSRPAKATPAAVTRAPGSVNSDPLAAYLARTNCGPHKESAPTCMSR
jgi:hypothetical protein